MSKLTKPRPGPSELQGKSHPLRDAVTYSSSRPAASWSSRSAPAITAAASSTAVDVRLPASQQSLQPRSVIEQYWAARALKAETLLSAHSLHRREITTLAAAEELRRSKELAALAEAYERRHAKLETLVVVLLACVLLCVALVIHLATRSAHHRDTPRYRWRPSHFTIPILSPFTSVVEHETSVIGSKSIALLILVLAGLAYAIFHRWHAQIRLR